MSRTFPTVNRYKKSILSFLLIIIAGLSLAPVLLAPKIVFADPPPFYLNYCSQCRPGGQPVGVPQGSYYITVIGNGYKATHVGEEMGYTEASKYFDQTYLRTFSGSNAYPIQKISFDQAKGAFPNDPTFNAGGGTTPGGTTPGGTPIDPSNPYQYQDYNVPPPGSPGNGQVWQYTYDQNDFGHWAPGSASNVPTQDGWGYSTPPDPEGVTGGHWNWVTSNPGNEATGEQASDLGTWTYVGGSGGTTGGTTPTQGCVACGQGGQPGGSGGGGGPQIGADGSLPPEISALFGGALSGALQGLLAGGGKAALRGALMGLVQTALQIGISKIGAIAGNIPGLGAILGSIPGLGSSLLGGLGGAAGGGGGGGQEVPVKDAIVRSTTTVIQQMTTMLKDKQYVLNPLAKKIAEGLIQKVVGGVIHWANTGFNGNPVFVQSPETLFAGIGQDISNDFISGNAIQSLCQPYQADIKESFTSSYGSAPSGTTGNQNYCQLSSGLNSDAAMQKFMGYTDTNPTTAPEQGTSWSDYGNFVSDMRNTPLGADLLANVALTNLVASEQVIAMQKTAGVYGIRPTEVCHGQVGANGTCLGVSEIKTPATVNETQINQAITHSQYDSLVNADEIQSIIGALANSLLEKLFKDDGLLGLTESGYDTQLSANGGTTGVSPKQQALQTIAKQLELVVGLSIKFKTTSLAYLGVGKQQFLDVINCYKNKDGLDSDEFKEAQTRVSNTTILMNKYVTPPQQAIEKDILDESYLASTMANFENEITLATSSSEVSRLFFQYQTFANDLPDVTTAEQETQDIKILVDGFKKDYTKALKECQAFGKGGPNTGGGTGGPNNPADTTVTLEKYQVKQGESAGINVITTGTAQGFYYSLKLLDQDGAYESTIVDEEYPQYALYSWTVTGVPGKHIIEVNVFDSATGELIAVDQSPVFTIIPSN